MENEKILVTKASLPYFDDYVDEIKDIWDSHWLTNNGTKVQKLEALLKEFLDVDNISLFTNGHLSLELLLQAMNLSGEVITTPYTFASTTHAIVRNGLTPVFCDINPDDYTIDVSKIESLITDKTTAIIPVHVYGNICDVEAIEKIANAYDLKVIYDAAHSFGEFFKGTAVGKFGDASMFSFHATKVFNTIEGGAVTYNSDNLGIILDRLKNFGIKSETVVDGVGSNAKMNEFQAAMGICNLKQVESDILKRKIIFNRYSIGLEQVQGIKLNKPSMDITSNYAYYPILINEKEYGKTRNELDEILKSENIFARKYFYPITSFFDAYHGKFDPYSTPIALHHSKRVLTLPLYPELSLDIVDKIINIIIDNKGK